MRRLLAASVAMGTLMVPALLFSTAQAQVTEIEPTDKGVSAEFIEHTAPVVMTRLSPMEDGGVMVTYSTPFLRDEVLTINEQNQPVLKTMEGETLVAHPSRRAAVHQNDIMIIDDRVNIADLQDNPFPYQTFTQHLAVQPGLAERPVSFETVDNTPISEADFDRALPALMQPTSTAVTPEGEREVSLPSGWDVTTPPGWRTAVVGNSMLILDERGVIQDVIPVY